MSTEWERNGHSEIFYINYLICLGLRFIFKRVQRTAYHHEQVIKRKINTSCPS